MKTTQKAFNKINDLTLAFNFFNEYIEKHPDGEKVKESVVFQKLRRKMVKLQADAIENNLM